MTISLKIEKMFYKIPFVNENCSKVYFTAIEDFQSGTGMLMCHCSDLISEDNYYSVPDVFQDMLGSSIIHLQPGSMRKQLNKEKYIQQFMFEIESDKNFTAGERIFFLEGPAQYIASKESNISSNQFN